MSRFTGWLKRSLRWPTLGGILGALVFWFRSLLPLLLPRSWMFQAAVSAVCIAVGCALGTLLGAIVHAVLARFDRRPGPALRAKVWKATPIVAGIVVVLGLVMWPIWQNDHRDLIGMPHISILSLLPLVLLTVVLTAVLFIVGRAVWTFVRYIEREFAARLPRPAAIVVTVIAFWLLGSVVVDAASARFHDWANTTYGLLEDDGTEGVDAPTSPTVSGSPDSLVPWSSLGREGRLFVTRSTPPEQLAAVAGSDADIVDPVRVYVGLESADTADERADLAVRELERAGGFDRSVLVVWTVTGTGWVDPDAALALEQVHGGDTAIVAQQYSFLPSWISTLVDGPVARDAGSALFDAVQRRWAQLPVDDRPQLIVFGLSLGSFGGETPFVGLDTRSSLGNIVSRTDGALFVGPTNDNELWQQLVADREDGSPAWMPVIGDSSTVVFANRPSEIDASDTSAWTTPRVLFVQHPTDPVTFFSFDSMTTRPEWLAEDTGPGVADQASWFPFVTFAQLVADLSAGFGAEPGFGHDYTNAYVAAWAAVAPPDGWTDADTQRVEDALDVPS